MCIVFSIVGSVCWYPRVTLSSMFVIESSYVNFLISSFLCIRFVILLWEWDEWLSPKDSGLLSFPSLHSLLMWLHSMFWLELIITFLCIFIVSLSTLLLFAIHLIRFIPLSFSYTDLLQVWYFPCITLAYLIISLIRFIVSLLILYSYWAPSSPCLMSFSIHVAFYTWGHEFFIIGYLCLVSLHFYYLITLAYITSCVLRPLWGYSIRRCLRQPLVG